MKKKFKLYGIVDNVYTLSKKNSMREYNRQLISPGDAHIKKIISFKEAPDSVNILGIFISLNNRRDLIQKKLISVPKENILQSKNSIYFSKGILLPVYFAL